MKTTHFQVITREPQTQARHALFTVAKGTSENNNQQNVKKLETPTCFVYTKAALPPNLTPDLFAEFKKLSSDGTLPAVQTSLQDLFADIRSYEKYQSGIHDYCSYPHDTIIYASIRDPSVFTDNTISNDSISLTSKSGKTKLTVTDYVNIHKNLQADIIESVSMDVPSHMTTAKKSRKSTDTANAWIDQAIKNDLHNIFGVIQGGNLLKTRGYAARDVAQRPVAGFVVGGLGLGETAEERVEIIREVLKYLPDDKPRLIPGIGNPNEVLQCIEMGIDLFNSNYPNIMTEWGHALTFTSSSNNNNTEVQPFKINLHDKQYQLSHDAILKDCACYTCQNHTRGYLHHLLCTHELLVNVLLSIHNTFHYLKFFSNIRAAIAAGKFQQFKKDFEQQYYPVSPS